MDFSSKCAVLSGLWVNYREEAKQHEAWNEFFQYNDVGLPLAHFIDVGYVTMNPESEGYYYVNETWRIFCEYINIDVNGDYASIWEAWDASPNLPLDVEEDLKEEVADSVEVKPVRKRARSAPAKG